MGMNWTTTKTATDRYFLASENYVSVMGILDSTVSDTAHTSKTHILREGICLHNSGGKWYRTDGSTHTTTEGVLFASVDMKDGDSSNSQTDHPAPIVVIGAVISGQLLEHSGTMNNRIYVVSTWTGQ